MKSLKYIGAIVAAPLLIFLWVYIPTMVIVHVSHNKILVGLTDKFGAIGHPESMLVKKVRQVGSFGGHGYCGYAVGEFRTSSLPRGGVRAFYADRSMRGLGTRYDDERLTFSVVYVDEYDTLRQDELPAQEWVGEFIRNNFVNMDTYLVFVVDGGHPTKGDWRCEE